MQEMADQALNQLTTAINIYQIGSKDRSIERKAFGNG
jgi:hypothetical protein